MTKQCKWRKRLALPYRVEYDCVRKKSELIGDNGIMALQDRTDDFGRGKPLSTWTVSKRHYVYPTGQRYKNIKHFSNKEDAVKFLKKYIKSN